MLDLRNVLELANDGLPDGTFPKQDFIHRRHEHVFHIVADACHQLNIERAQEFVKEMPVQVPKQEVHR
jgi:hypothetical protein